MSARFISLCILVVLGLQLTFAGDPVEDAKTKGQEMLADEVEKAGIPTGESAYEGQGDEMPGYANFEVSGETSWNVTTDTKITIEGHKSQESRDRAFDQSRWTSQGGSATIENSNGFKITVFQEKQGYYLKNIIRAKTDISAHAEVHGEASANWSDMYEVDGPSMSGMFDTALQVQANANANASLDASADFNGTIDTEAEIDLNLVQKERGILMAVPLWNSDETNARLILETGYKQRTDFMVLKVVKARSTLNGNVSAGYDANLNGQVGGTATGLVNGTPIGSYSNAIPFNYSKSDSGSTSVGGSADVLAIARGAGAKTTYGSESSYYVIPVGIGFYSANGSKIRLMVDLKPERMNKPLNFKAPSSVEDLDSFMLNAIGGAALETEGRLNFDSFTLLAGLNANFRTFEVNLKDVTGDDVTTTLPSNVHADFYVGVETQSTDVKLIAEANVRMLEADAGVFVDLKHRFDNGWSFGIVTGFQKKFMPKIGETSVDGSNLTNGTYDGPSGGGNFDGTNGSYNYSSNAAYSADHGGTVINQGNGSGYYDEYNVIPVDLAVQGPLTSNTTLLAGGSAEFVDNLGDSRGYELNKVGGRLGVDYDYGRGNMWGEIQGGAQKRNYGMHDDKYEPYVGVGVGISF
jgi:hypothetical protein